MRNYLIAMIIILMANSANASDSTWDNTDTALQCVNGALFVADALQTLDIKNHKSMYETNPILGKHPSDAEVMGYFIGTFAIHSVVAYYLPDLLFKPKTASLFRKGIITLSIGVESAVIHHNYQMGIKVKF